MYRFIDKSGRRVGKAEYEWADSFRNGSACVKPPSLPVCFVDHQERVRVYLPDYQKDRTHFHDRRALLTKGRFFGFADETGREVISPVYLYASSFSEGVAPVQLREGFRYTFIGPDGRHLGPAIFHDLRNLSDGLAVAEVAGEAYYADRELKTVLGPFEKAHSFWEGVACVTGSGKQQYIDRTGCVVFTSQWEWLSPHCSEGRIPFIQNGRKGFLDKAGRVVIPAVYRGVDFFSEGVALVETPGEKLALDLEGRVLFETPKYEWMGHLKDGRLRFKQKGKFGFLDREGNVAIERRFNEAEDFSEGVAAVDEG
jgi:hypothetical protein